MTGDRVALAINDLLGIILVIRLLSLRLHRVYRVFCILVLVQLAGTSLFIFEIFNQAYDYRKTWLIETVVSWAVLLWLVYIFLGAVLATLPGILRVSRKVLNGAYALAAVAAGLGARAALVMFSDHRTLRAALQATFLMDRVISAAALLILLAILAFVLWFPVQMPRNLVMFSFGLIAYFTAQVGLLLIRDFIPSLPAHFLSIAASLASAFCFLYWSLAITRQGEGASLRMGHGWEPMEQKRLLDQLENMNTALLRNARRS
jgi:uncharacterized membrane protein